MRLASILAVLVALPPSAFAAPKPGILAVLELRNKLKRGDVDAGYLSDRVRSAVLREVPSMEVITRENLLVLIEATGRKLEDCEGECEIDTGRRIGADYVISGDLLGFGSALKVNLRLHETAGGSMLAGVVASGQSADELDANLGHAVAELMKPFGQPDRAAAAYEFVPPPALPISPDVPRELLPLRETALRLDEPGTPHPQEVLLAWQRLADAPGANPYRIDARNRAEYWRGYANRFAKLEQAMAMTDLSPANKQKMIDGFAGEFGSGVVEPLIKAVQPGASRAAICSGLASRLKPLRIAVRAVGPMGRDAAADVEVDGRAVGKAPGDIAAPPCAETISLVVPGEAARTLPLTPQTSEVFALVPGRSWSLGMLASMTFDLAGASGSGSTASVDATTYGPMPALFLLGEFIQARAGVRLGFVRNISTCVQPCSHNAEVDVVLGAGGVYWLGSGVPVPPSWRVGAGLRIESGFASGEMQTANGVLDWRGAPIVPTASVFVAYRRAFFVEPSLGQEVALAGTCTVRGAAGSSASADCAVLNRRRLALSFGYGF